MTRTDAPTDTDTDVASEADSPPSDPRSLFAAAVDRAEPVVAAVTAAALGRPTPCTDFDVETLTRHLVSGVRRIASVARGEDLATVPTIVDDVSSDGFPGAFAAARREQEAAWASDDLLDRPLTLPFAVLPGRVAMAIFVGELTVHTWDLAAALDLPVEWDQDAAARALAGMQVALPPDPRGPEHGIPFGPVVPTAADADPIEKLVAWVGRDPAWSAV